MIIVKAPLRISIGGGGTDLPSYYREFGSHFISAAINKYVYISLHPIFIKDIILKYSELERVQNPEAIEHPILRESLLQCGVRDSVEISSFADIPAGTGLGSSGSFTVALLKALYTHKNILHNNMTLAEDACVIEIDKLKSPIGKQDQYASAIGGLNCFEIDKNGKVSATPLAMPPSARIELEEHLLLFFTGYSRSANSILQDQDQKTQMALKNRDPEAEEQRALAREMIDNLHVVKEFGFQIRRGLESGDVASFGKVMNEHWKYKRQRSKGISNPKIDEWYELGVKNGALGGKLIGAGGGGFLMFLAEDKRALRKAMASAGLQETPFRLDTLGAQVVLHD